MKILLIGGGYCVIYCSSNNIWYPNEQKYFEYSFIENDRYEWLAVECKLASKEIYVRDIYKSWYVTGINSDLNTIDKVVEFLKSRVNGYRIITIGSSAGAYLAVLLGILLRADHVVAFSPQFELNNRWAISGNPFLKRYATDPVRFKYYDLKPVMKDSDIPIYYIYPCKNESDVYQYHHIKDVSCVKPIVFYSSHHGVVVLRNNLSRLISMNREELEALYRKYDSKKIQPVIFSITFIGFFKTVGEVVRTGVRILKKIVKFRMEGIDS